MDTGAGKKEDNEEASNAPEAEKDAPATAAVDEIAVCNAPAEPPLAAPEKSAPDTTPAPSKSDAPTAPPSASKSAAEPEPDSDSSSNSDDGKVNNEKRE